MKTYKKKFGSGMQEKRIVTVLLGITAAAILSIFFYTAGASTQDDIQLISMETLSMTAENSVATEPESASTTSAVTQSGETASSSESEPTSSSSTQVSQEKLNLNTATLEELMEVPHIGKVTAGKILDYRKKAGSFQTVEELLNISGIGEKTFANLKDYFTVS